MKMTAFRVQNYRSILDSGWCEVDELTAIVGKNESGKTSLLKALWKFNPYQPAPYDLSREWPRGHRRQMRVEQPVITVRFVFTPEEQQQLSDLHPSAAGITEVEIQRNYAGIYRYTFLPHPPMDAPPIASAFETLKNIFGGAPQSMLRQLKDRSTALLRELLKLERTEERAEPSEEASLVQEMIFTVPAPARPNLDTTLDPLQRSIDQAVAEISGQLPARLAVMLVHQWLPTFIYMDDYKIFHGAAQLDQIAQRKREHRLTEEDRTLLTIMNMAGLDLDDEVRKISRPDREQRILDLNDASRTLTDEIAHRWSQKRYEVMFQADGNHFITFVKDVDTHILVPLEERSKGFQWFFSFDMTFMYETHGQFQNAVLLLDEPGLHLHAAAQSDLLARIREYAHNNQLIYTTHLPFMLDFTRPGAIRIAEDNGYEGTRIHTDWAGVDADARFTLQAAMGLALSRQLLQDQYNLIVEAASDYWLLSALAEMCGDSGCPGLDERLIITPLGGATTTAFAGLLLQRRQLNIAVLAASHVADSAVQDEATRRWIQDDSRVIALDRMLELPYPCTLEDVFTDDYYCAHVQAVYRLELGGQPLRLSATAAPLLERVTEALAQRGITRFNKSRVARHLLQTLNGQTLEILPEVTMQRATRIIAAINRVVGGWDSELPDTTQLPVTVPATSLAPDKFQ